MKQIGELLRDGQLTEGALKSRLNAMLTDEIMDRCGEVIINENLMYSLEVVTGKKVYLEVVIRNSKAEVPTSKNKTYDERFDLMVDITERTEEHLEENLIEDIAKVLGQIHTYGILSEALVSRIKDNNKCMFDIWQPALEIFGRLQ